MLIVQAIRVYVAAPRGLSTGGSASAGVRKPAGHVASSIAVKQTPFGEGVLPDSSSSGSNPEAEAVDKLRERCKVMLQMHMRHSSPREVTNGSSAAVTHQRTMQCSRNAALHGVVQEVLEALSKHAAKVVRPTRAIIHVVQGSSDACCMVSS